MNRKTFANNISDAKERNNKKFEIAKMGQTPLKSVIDLDQSPPLDLVRLLDDSITEECTTLLMLKEFRKKCQIAITTELGYIHC